MDAGGYFEPLGPRSERVNATMLESLGRLPVDVLNLTPRDLHEWDRLHAQSPPTRVISSNLVPRDESKPAPAPTALLEHETPAGVVRIGFLGLSDPSSVKPNSGFRAIPPREALASLLPELARQADVVVLLADLPQSAAAALADAFREIDVIVRAEPRAVLPPPQIAGNAVVVCSVERGRSLGLLTLTLDKAGKVESAKPDWISLDSQIPEDPYFKARQVELDEKP